MMNSPAKKLYYCLADKLNNSCGLGGDEKIFHQVHTDFFPPAVLHCADSPTYRYRVGSVVAVGPPVRPDQSVRRPGSRLWSQLLDQTGPSSSPPLAGGFVSGQGPAPASA